MRALFFILLALVAFARTDAAQAADDISRIPRIGFKTATRLAANGLCGRIADAMLARENIRIAEAGAADAILIVRPIEPTLFPKRIASIKELLKRLSGEAHPCAHEQLDANTVALVYEKQSDGSMLRVLKYALNHCAIWKGDVFCGGPVLTPAYLNIEFVRGSIGPGLDQLRKAFGLVPTSATQMALSPEQERIFRQDPDSALLPADFFIRYNFYIEPPQEDAWAFILNRLPYIENAERARLKLVSLDATRTIATNEAINNRPRSALVNGTIPLPNAQARSLAFLRSWFKKKGGMLTVLKRDDNRLRIRVDRLRGEVIRQETFWEYLTINLILIDNPTRTTLYLINDGYYAAGLGSRVPPDISFKSMEQEYHSNLTEYTDALATQIQDGLGGQP